MSAAADENTAADGRIYRRIARNSAFLAAGTTAAAVLIMIAVALTARALDAREFGMVVLLQSAAMLVRSLMSFSTQQPVIKLGSEAQAIGDKQQFGEIISMGLLVDIVAALLSFAVAVIVIVAFNDLVGLTGRDVRFAWIFGGAVIFMGFPSSNGILRVYNSFGALSLIQTLSAAATLVLVAILAVHAAGLEAFVWAWAVSYVLPSQLQLLFALYLLRRDSVPLHFRLGSFSTAGGRSLLQYSWTTWGTSSADSVRSYGDLLLVGAIVSVEGAGLYSVAKQLAGVVRKFNMVYASTVFPEIARLSSRRDVRGARLLKRRMMIVGIAVGLVAVVAAAVVGEPILGILFGPRFTPAHGALIVLTAAAGVQLMSHTPSMYVQVYVSPKRLLFLYIVATAAFALAAVPLTMSFAITGMASAHLMFGIVLVLLCELSLRARAIVAPVPEREK